MFPMKLSRSGFPKEVDNCSGYMPCGLWASKKLSKIAEKWLSYRLQNWDLHYVKSVFIRSYSGLNVGKCGPEYLRIRTLFTECWFSMLSWQCHKNLHQIISVTSFSGRKSSLKIELKRAAKNRDNYGTNLVVIVLLSYMVCIVFGLTCWQSFMAIRAHFRNPRSCS